MRAWEKQKDGIRVTASIVMKAGKSTLTNSASFLAIPN
jgi:hypothetical protein